MFPPGYGKNDDCDERRQSESVMPKLQPSIAAFLVRGDARPGVFVGGVVRVVERILNEFFKIRIVR